MILGQAEEAQCLRRAQMVSQPAFRNSGESSRFCDLWSLTVVSDRIHDHLHLHLQCELIHIHGLEALDLRDDLSVDDGVSGRTETSRWTLDVQLLGTLLVVAFLSSPRGQETWRLHKELTFQNLNSTFVVEKKVENGKGSNGLVSDFNLSETPMLKKNKN